MAAYRLDVETKRVEMLTYLFCIYKKKCYYMVSHLVADLGRDELDLGCSPGSWVVTVAAYCPGRVVEHPKSKSTQPRSATR